MSTVLGVLLVLLILLVKLVMVLFWPVVGIAACMCFGAMLGRMLP